MRRFVIFEVILICLSFVIGLSCNKGDNATNDNTTGNGSTPPNPNSTYVRYTLSNGAGNPLYVNATSPGSFYLYAPSGDTSRVLFIFSNDKISMSNPSWNLCSANYDVQGKDFFTIFFLWTGSPAKALTAGRTYNLNTFESFNPLPAAQTTGVATYRHTNSTGTTLETWNTMNNALGSSGRSFLKIDKVENNTASGSFQFVFSCQPSGSGYLNLNYVTGTFNKIPLTQ